MKRIGVIANQASVDSRYRHVVDVMHARGDDIVAIFGPEHGFRGSAQAGLSEPTTIDPRTGITVHDMYRADWKEALAGVETVLFDLPDIGTRFYTYIWTLYDSLHAALELGLRYVVIDRPNPIGPAMRGPVLQPGFESGVGRFPIPQQHGLTIGELARLFDPRVVVIAGEPRPWVMPSPNLPTLDTAQIYPGTGMFEGTNVSEGRGTTRPFELIGAPFLDHRFADRLNARSVPGVIFREAHFADCIGVQVHVTDVGVFDAVATGVAMLVEAKRYKDFEWRTEWIDKLTGSSRLREMIDAGADVPEIVAAWTSELDEFAERVNHLRDQIVV